MGEVNERLSDVIGAYVIEIDKIWRTGNATEHSYRGALQQMLAALMPGLTVLNEPKKQACGAPDYIIADRTGRAVSFVEAKDIGDPDLDGNRRTGHKEQFDRYKVSLDAIAFTDYLDFRLYLHGEKAAEVKIAELGGRSSSTAAGRIVPLSGNFGAFLSLVDSLATARPVRIGSATQLARLMAGKARLLQHTAREFLARSGDDTPRDGEPPRTDVGRILSDFRRALVPDIGADEFADVYAQTITYGMFAARLHDRTPEDFSRFEAAALIPKSNPFLKQLFNHLSGNMDDEIEWVVNDIAALFAVADVAKIMHGYGRATGQADPMIHFYEDFLAQYDAGLRKDRGVWYTPLPVVGFIVRAVDEILQTRFSLPDGLADASKTEIEVEEFTASGKRTTQKVRRSVHKVQVLDPALGTGTFIAECIRRIHAKFAGNEGAWPGYAEEDLMPRLNGFELLMASYTMAHIKLDMTLAETGGRPNQRFKVFLTNSLVEENSDAMFGELFALSLGEEARGADAVKRDTPVMVVIGNPPYSGESQNKGDWIMRLMEAYKKEPGGKEKLKERNPKWLNDDYVKFLRLAEHYIEKNGSGIVAYINPHGFLDNPTFRGMRWHLMQTFDEMYFLNLHGNAKKKESAPDGGKDECVFDIMQGVSINVFVKRGRGGPQSSAAADAQERVPPCRVFYVDLWGKRAEKFAALDAATFGSIEWQELTPTAPMFFFVPKDTEGEEEYNKGFRVDELMPVNSSGVVSANDELNFSFTEEEQKGKINDLLSMSEHDWRIKYHRAKDSRDWAYAFAFSDAKSNGRYCKAAYRIFDDRFTFYTGTSKGLYTNPRDMVMRHFATMAKGVAFAAGRLGVSEDGGECSKLPNSQTPSSESNEGNIGLVCLKGFPKDSPPCFVTDAITEHRYWSCSGMQGTDYVFPLWLYEENMGQVERRANLNPEIVARIEAAVAGAGGAQFTAPENADAINCVPPQAIFDYVYAILHMPEYRAKYREFLKTDFPRIPYPKDGETFRRFAAIGAQLRTTHLMKDPMPTLAERTAAFPVAGNNVVDSVRFDLTQRHRDTEINEGGKNSEPLGLCVKNQCGRVYINDTQYFDNVTQEDFEFFIGGYQPAQKWLKDRKGRALTRDDLRHYQRIVLALRRTRTLMASLSDLARM